MNATARKQLRHIIAAALPRDTPSETLRRLTRALLMQIREWRADQRYRPAFDAPKLIAERDGLRKLSDCARLALQEARRELGLPREFQAAVDKAVEERREQTAEHGIMSRSADGSKDCPYPGNPYGISPIECSFGRIASFNDLSPAETLDVHLAHAIADLSDWDKDHRNPPHRPRSESTRLANDLYSIAEQFGLTPKRIVNLLDALSGSCGLPMFDADSVRRLRSSRTSPA